MKKITVTIKDNTILFKYRIKKPVEPNLLNTNVISNNELVFSDEYLKENVKIVSLFLNELIQEKEITDVVISDMATEIGEYAFAYASNLVNVEIGDGVFLMLYAKKL